MQHSAAGIAPATAGELVQGTLDGKDFLITSPINLYSQANATIRDGRLIQVTNRGEYSKVEKATRQLLDFLGLPAKAAVIQLESQIPRGKGLASSTSEMLAAMRAVLKATGKTATPAQLAQIATSVEASDSIFFPGIVRGNPLTGELYESYGSPPPAGVILVDTGGEVDTAQFDRAKARHNSRQFEMPLRRAVELVKTGIRTQSVRNIAEGATISAEIHQRVLFKPPFDELRRGTAEFGGLGVNCAHTGTVLGVLFDPKYTTGSRLEQRVAKLVGKKSILGNYRLIASNARLA